MDDLYLRAKALWDACQSVKPRWDQLGSVTMSVWVDKVKQGITPEDYKVNAKPPVLLQTGRRITRVRITDTAPLPMVRNPLVARRTRPAVEAATEEELQDTRSSGTGRTEIRNARPLLVKRTTPVDSNNSSSGNLLARTVRVPDDWGAQNQPRNASSSRFVRRRVGEGVPQSRASDTEPTQAQIRGTRIVRRTRSVG